MEFLPADSCADPRRIPPEDAERLVVDIASCPDAEGVIGALEDESGNAIRFTGAERVGCPVLIVLPERDRFFTRFHAERYAQALTPPSKFSPTAATAQCSTARNRELEDPKLHRLDPAAAILQRRQAREPCAGSELLGVARPTQLR